MGLPSLAPFTHLEIYIYQFTQFKYLHSVLGTMGIWGMGGAIYLLVGVVKGGFAFQSTLVTLAAEIPDRVPVSGRSVGRFYPLTTPSFSCWWVSEVDAIRD